MGHGRRLGGMVTTNIGVFFSGTIWYNHHGAADQADHTNQPLLGLYNFVSTLVPLGCAQLSPIAIVDSWNLLEWDTHCDYAYWQGEGIMTNDHEDIQWQPCMIMRPYLLIGP